MTHYLPSEALKRCTIKLGKLFSLVSHKHSYKLDFLSSVAVEMIPILDDMIRLLMITLFPCDDSDIVQETSSFEILKIFIV
jgi:hypothetical protein